MPAMPKSHIAAINSIDGMPPGSARSTAAAAVELDESTYEARRRGLIVEEQQRRFDAVRRAKRTETERKADEVVRRLRGDELKDVYDAPGKVSVAKGTTWARAKSRGVEEGTLFKLIKEMPKGALLHCHLDATVDANWLLKQTYNERQLYMRAEKALTTHAALYDTLAVFRLLPDETGTPADGGFARAVEGKDDIYQPSYEPNTWVRLERARFSFPYANIYAEPIDGYESILKDFYQPDLTTSPSPNAVAFDAFLHSKMTFTPVPASLSPPIVTSKEAWHFFAQTFAIIEGLQTHALRFAYYVRSFELAIKDKVQYVEARINFFDKLYTGPDGQASLTHSGVVELFEKALEHVRSRLPAGKSFDAKIIYSTLRFIDAESLQWYIDDAIALKKRFPDRVVGFDLVGHEDVGVTLREYVPQLLAMQRRLRDTEGVQLPFCFHAGETLGDGDAIDANLYDALLLGTRRIGHGFSLSRHPTLVEVCRERGVCIESCPISNQVLRYTDTMAVHPVLTLLAYGCPVALSNDDPCQFLNIGLSPDFYSILIASDHFDLTSLAVLARTSLEHSLIPDEKQKSNLIAAWEEHWKVFVENVASLDSAR